MAGIIYPGFTADEPTAAGRAMVTAVDAAAQRSLLGFDFIPADGSVVVHLAGAETVTGQKTFNQPLRIATPAVAGGGLWMGVVENGVDKFGYRDIDNGDLYIAAKSPLSRALRIIPSDSVSGDVAFRSNGSVYAFRNYLGSYATVQASALDNPVAALTLGNATYGAAVAGALTAIKFQLSENVYSATPSIEGMSSTAPNYGLQFTFGSSHKFTFSPDYPTGYSYLGDYRWALRPYGTNEVGYGLMFQNSGVQVALSGDYSANLNVRNGAGVLTGINSGNLYVGNAASPTTPSVITMDSWGNNCSWRMESNYNSGSGNTWLLTSNNTDYTPLLANSNTSTLTTGGDLVVVGSAIFTTAGSILNQFNTLTANAVYGFSVNAPSSEFVTTNNAVRTFNIKSQGSAIGFALNSFGSDIFKISGSTGDVTVGVSGSGTVTSALFSSPTTYPYTAELRSQGYTGQAGNPRVVVDALNGAVLNGGFKGVTIGSDVAYAGVAISRQVVINQNWNAAIPLTIKGATNQISNLLEVQDSSATVLASVSAVGDLSAKQATFKLNGLNDSVRIEYNNQNTYAYGFSSPGNGWLTLGNLAGGTYIAFQPAGNQASLFGTWNMPANAGYAGPVRLCAENASGGQNYLNLLNTGTGAGQTIAGNTVCYAVSGEPPYLDLSARRVRFGAYTNGSNPARVWNDFATDWEMSVDPGYVTFNSTVTLHNGSANTYLQQSGPTLYVSNYGGTGASTRFFQNGSESLWLYEGFVEIPCPTTSNADVTRQLIISDNGTDRIILAHDTARSRLTLIAPNGAEARFDQTNSGLTASCGTGWGFYSSSGNSGFLNYATGFEAIANSSSFYMRGGADAPRLFVVGAAGQTTPLQRWTNNAYTDQASMSATGDLIVNSLGIGISPAYGFHLVSTKTARFEGTSQFMGTMEYPAAAYAQFNTTAQIRHLDTYTMLGPDAGLSLGFDTSRNATFGGDITVAKTNPHLKLQAVSNTSPAVVFSNSAKTFSWNLNSDGDFQLTDNTVGPSRMVIRSNGQIGFGDYYGPSNYPQASVSTPGNLSTGYATGATVAVPSGGSNFAGGWRVQSYGQPTAYDTTFDGNNLTCNYASFAITNVWGAIALQGVTGLDFNPTSYGDSRFWGSLTQGVSGAATISSRWVMTATGARKSEVGDGAGSWQTGSREEYNASGIRCGFYNATPIARQQIISGSATLAADLLVALNNLGLVQSL